MENARYFFDEYFDLDPYLREKDLRVTACKPYKSADFPEVNYKVSLDRTLFYPERGGQPGDSGFLSGNRVYYTLYDNKDENPATIWHLCSEPLEPGQIVKGVIDWERRFSFMQQHSAEHILSGLTHEHYGYDNVGFHLGEDITTLDFNGPLTEEQLSRLIYETNQKVWENILIDIRSVSETEANELQYRSKLEIQGNIRLVQVAGADLCACSGTHVRRTGEIGLVIATGLEKWKKGVRITLLAGNRAVVYAEDNQRTLRTLGHKLHLPFSELPEGLDRLYNRLEEREKQVEAAALALFQAKVEYNSPITLVELQSSFYDDNFCKYILKQISQADSPATVLLLLNNSSVKQPRFFLTKPLTTESLLQKLRQEFAAKGGGPPQLSQGTIPGADPQTIGNTLAEFLEADNYVL